ncbi:phage terminase large subunit [Brevundimonas sp. Leaf363]|uniref:phage terminase large subunit n=1 Tax=Brevundimonas sp. Leaf363 TaxID=1736353 RepID=UPI00138F8C17|nr:phage terminase large subunit [Brevundimonas sp. Leaf363]
MPNLDPKTAMVARRLLNEKARTDFYTFQRVMHPHASSHAYVDAVHLRAICWKLQQMVDTDLNRLAVAIPPRHFKSYLISIAFPAFILGLDPSYEIICASYGFDLADPLARACRQMMMSDRYAEIFPATKLSSKTPPAQFLRTTAGGYRFTTTTSGAMTGLGADMLIYDDPLKAGDAGSQAARDAAWEWVENAPSRITLGKGQIILPMQRLHADDPIGRLKDKGSWDLLELPAQFALPARVQIGPDQFKDFKPGELLFSARFTQAILKERRDEIGERAFNAQYLQAPAPPGGRLFRLEQFQRFNLSSNNKKSQYEAILMSIDPGVSSAPSGDPTAMTIWGVRGLNVYLLHAERGNWTHAQQVKKVQAYRSQCHCVLIERSHSGIVLSEGLNEAAPEPNNLMGFTPKLDKYVRAEAAAFAMEKGRIHLPHAAPWLPEFEKEIVVFPHGANDDYVDSMSQLFRQLDMGFPYTVPLKAYKPNTPQVKVTVY